MEPAPIACDLSKLSQEERLREQELLARFKQMIRGSVETDRGYLYTVSAAPATLAALGELLALERLCCPFLTFEVKVSAQQEASVHISGGSGVKEFIAAEFSRQEMDVSNT